MKYIIATLMLCSFAQAKEVTVIDLTSTKWCEISVGGHFVSLYTFNNDSSFKRESLIKPVEQTPVTGSWTLQGQSLEITDMYGYSYHYQLYVSSYDPEYRTLSITSGELRGVEVARSCKL